MQTSPVVPGQPQEAPSPPPHARLRARWLVPALGAVVLGLSAYALYHVFHQYRYRDVLQGLREIPRGRLALAALLTFLSYAALTGYDALALRYVRHPLSYRKVGLASFVSYAFSNSIGLSFLTGLSARFRVYSGWGVSATDISRIVAFCAVTLWLGFLVVGGAALVLEPARLSAAVSLGPALLRAIGAAMLGAVTLYVVWCARQRPRLMVRGMEFRPPRIRVALGQLLVASLDVFLYAGALYVLIPDRAGIGFPAFAATFIVAQVIALASHVPGGLGVLESMTLLLLSPSVPPGELAGALLAFRAIYYLAPLALAGLLLAGHEVARQTRGLGLLPRQLGRSVAELVPGVFAVLCFASGMVLLFSGATPALAGRLEGLRLLVPLPVVELSHFLASLAGVALLLLAQGLLRRLDGAYVSTLAVLATGVVASLLKGWDYEEALLLLGLFAALLPCRNRFYRKASLLNEHLSPAWMMAVGLVLVASIGLGFFAHRHTNYSGELWWRFAFRGDAPRFLRASVGAMALAAGFGLTRLLRPVRHDPGVPEPDQLERAAAVVRTSRTASACLALTGDKALLFSDTGRSFIMYAVEGRSWIAMGDPVGDETELGELAWRFRELCDRHGGRPVFHEVRAERLPMYLDLGLTLLKLGEEARVALTTFSLEGSHRQSLRRALRECEKAGCTMAIVAPGSAAALLPEIRLVSDDWLESKRTREKGFSLGFFDEAYLQRFPLAVVRQEERIVAFANIWQSAGRAEMTVDLMRFGSAAPRSVMTYLFVKLFLWGSAEGYEWFNLGMAPLAGLRRRPLAPTWARVGGFVFRHAEHFYNFQGLRQYKDRFDPVWEPRYLATPGGLSLPVVLTNLASLIARGLRGVVSK